MSAYDDFRVLATRWQEQNPSQRAGQAHFNCLHVLHPEIADEIHSGPADPFYLDARLPAFHETVAKLMGET